MKNILIALSFLLLGFKAQSQLIIPIDRMSEFLKKNDVEPNDNIYIKDVNNILDNFTGSWEGELENNFYSFEITKKIKTTNLLFPNNLEDKLVIQFKITDKNTRQLLYNKSNIPESNQISYMRYTEITEKKYAVFYFGESQEKINCGDIGSMYIELTRSGEMKVYVEASPIGHIIKEGEEHPCASGKTPPPFPSKKDKPLVLTKK